MSLRTGLLALAFSAAALPALAHDPGAAPGAQGAAPAFRDIETQYIFGFTSGADIGAEMVALTKYQILMQASTSALSNANQSSQVVLGLFR